MAQVLGSMGPDVLGDSWAGAGSPPRCGGSQLLLEGVDIHGTSSSTNNLQLILSKSRMCEPPLRGMFLEQ